MVNHHLSKQLADERAGDIHRAVAASARGAAATSRGARRTVITALRRSRAGRSKLITIEDLGR